MKHNMHEMYNTCIKYTYIHIHITHALPKHTWVYMHHIYIHTPPNTCPLYTWWHMYNIQIQTPHVSPKTYMTIHAPHIHTCTTKHMCTTKYHQNIRYTQLAFPLYSMKHQVQMRDLCWISYFWCFSLCVSLFRCFSWKPQHFSWKLLLFMRTTMVFIVSFWVITKYRSFVRKTKYGHYGNVLWLGTFLYMHQNYVIYPAN